jgi:hypothetical protein
MSIVFTEIPGRDGKADVLGLREYTRLFTAQWTPADNPVTEVDVWAAAGCPRKYDPLGPQDPGARCLDVQVTETSFTNARVNCHYSTKYGQEEVENQPNPLLRPAVWKYSSEERTRTDARDRKGNPYSTPVVQEPFASPPQYPYGISRWTVTKNFATFSDTMAEAFTSTVNSAAWKGKAKYAVMCKSITADEQWENNCHFWTHNYVFLVDSRRLWMPVEVASKGYRYLESTGGVEKTSKTLVWIDAAGQKTTTPTYLDRYPFDEINFSGLPI